MVFCIYIFLMYVSNCSIVSHNIFEDSGLPAFYICLSLIQKFFFHLYTQNYMHTCTYKTWHMYIYIWRLYTWVYLKGSICLAVYISMLAFPLIFVIKFYWEYRTWEIYFLISKYFSWKLANFSRWSIAKFNKIL